MVKDKIQKREAFYGTWSEIYSPYMADILSQTGLDFIVIDREHGAFSMETVQNMTFASQKNGCDVFVRVSEFEKSSILNVLDMGVNGIIFPHIHSLNQIEEIEQNVLFPPRGKRGYNPFVCSCGYKSITNEEVNKKNDDLIVSVIIEDLEGIDNLPQLVQSKTIDIFYIGQYDLSISMGIPGDIENEKLLKKIDKAVAIINAAGKVAGCMVHNAASAKKAVANGCNMIMYGVDTNVVLRAYNDFIREAKNEII